MATVFDGIANCITMNQDYPVAVLIQGIVRSQVAEHVQLVIQRGWARPLVKVLANETHDSSSACQPAALESIEGLLRHCEVHGMMAIGGDFDVDGGFGMCCALCEVDIIRVE